MSRLKRLLIVCLAIAFASQAHAQPAVGEVRVRAVDDSGTPVTADGVLEGQATSVRRAFQTDAARAVVVPALPFGIYRLQLTRAGFAAYSTIIDVRSEIPINHSAALGLAPLQATVNVSAASETLLDPYRPSAVTYLGGETLRDRPVAAPGRSMIELISMQPGWLLEANGILHARGSEYQVQYVVDGIPLRDNRSPAFAQSFGIEAFESMTIRTAGYPAEFGGKAGGVIEVSTVRDAREGIHGGATVEAGSHSAVAGSGAVNVARAGTSAGVDLEGMTTDRYLDPPTEGNFTNRGRGAGVAARVERSWTDAGRTRLYAYARTTRFQVPNEAVQEEAGQVQERTTSERLVQISHQQVLSPRALLRLSAMARDTGAELTSNARSTPIRVSQDRGFREGHVNGSLALHRGRHEFKFGGEATFTPIREAFAFALVTRILDGARVVDDDVPDAFVFKARADRSEQAVYLQDLIRLGPATVSAGLRYDRYHLKVAESALSPRVSASWFLEPAAVVIHGSYDRIFETQPVENLLLGSSDVVDALGGEGRQLGLRPSRGHFFEAGLSRAWADRWRVDANVFTRRLQNMTDDELLLNTGVSFPVAFSTAVVTGFEAKVELSRWGRVGGWLAYSLSKGTGSLPLTGGLFLGDDIEEQLGSREEFPLSQDQRHTLRARVRVEASARAWLAAGTRFDSGLPVEIDGDEEPNEDLLIRQYGRAVFDRVDFDRGRVKPSFTVDLSAGLKLTERERGGLTVQVDVVNLTNRLNVINFAGLFSGTAVAPGRGAAIRLRAEF